MTEAAQTLCDQLLPKLHEHHVQAGVGHYGILNGSIYKKEIAPRLQTFMTRHAHPRKKAG